MVLTGQRMGQIFPLSAKGTVFGRAPDVDVVLDDDGISRVHAMIMQEEDRWVVRDLGSTNGTFVAERRVGETPLMLREGDRIRCGSDILIRFGQRAVLEASFLVPFVRAATRDDLTGLMKPALFLEHLEIEVAWHQRHELPLSVVFVDIDHLEAVNETFGRGAGDDVLRGAAAELEAATRTEDVVARFPHAFAVLLRHTDAQSAHELADSFRHRIGAHTFVLEGRKARVTTSAGVATHEELQLVSGEALLRAADDHLIAAKQQGRDQTVSDWRG